MTLIPVLVVCVAILPAPHASSVPVAQPPASQSNAELDDLLDRVQRYLDDYLREFANVVAEERYVQSLPDSSPGAWSVTRRLRSDLLFIRTQGSIGWQSFRDVFEVDGRPVRDREDRLKRLFLDPSPAAQDRLQTIRDESARYNLGPVVRTINVPLFPLTFLASHLRPRFTFTRAGALESAGVRARKVEFVERARPTIVTDLGDGDMPMKGWFIVDEKTGAVLETGVRISPAGSTAEIVVRYQHDPAAGSWVPSRMTETYQHIRGNELITAGEAEYSNFRRFQVKTEEKIVIPK